MKLIYNEIMGHWKHIIKRYMTSPNNYHVLVAKLSIPNENILKTAQSTRKTIDVGLVLMMSRKNVGK
eukprot:snap_masked-scaffold_52-processed-gene-0.18-mRNA-1 protein AED:1.00 eAED:1.00 QI:0/-1/0/0/-1/1/1/0/66